MKSKTISGIDGDRVEIEAGTYSIISSKRIVLLTARDGCADSSCRGTVAALTPAAPLRLAAALTELAGKKAGRR